MIKTYNRRPLSVATPSASDVKEHYFNHYNWKGINDNKNFLTVDQDSFEDAINVYVNEEGMLRSRPSIKNNGEDIIYFWKLNEITYVKLIGVDELNANLIIFKNNEQLGDPLIIPATSLKEGLPKLALLKDLLIVFTSVDIHGNKDGVWLEFNDFLHIPELTTDEDYNKNVLLSTFKRVYQYNNDIYNELEENALGETLYYSYDGEIKSFKFNSIRDLDYVKNVYYDGKMYLNSKIFAKTNKSGKQVVVIVNNDVVKCIYDDTSVYVLPTIPNINQYDHVLYSLSYDGSIFAAVTFTIDIDNFDTIHTTLHTIDPAIPSSKWTSKDIGGFSFSYDQLLHNSIDSIYDFVFADFKDYGTENQRPYCSIFYRTTNNLIHCVIYENYYNTIVTTATPTTLIFDLDNKVKDYVNENKLFIAYSIYYTLEHGFIRYGWYVNDEGKLDNKIVERKYVTDDFNDAFDKFAGGYIGIAGSTLESLYCIIDESLRLRCLVSYDDPNVVLEHLPEAENVYDSYPVNIYKFNKLRTLYYVELNYNGDLYTNYSPWFNEYFEAIFNLTDDNMFDIDNSFHYKEWVAGDKYFYYINKNGDVVSNNIPIAINVYTLSKGAVNHIYPDNLLVDDDVLYLSKGNTFYVSEPAFGSNNNFQLYIPERNKNVFNSNVSNIYQISDDYITVFFENENYIVSKTDVTFEGDPVTYTAYLYVKSKLPIGVKQGSDVITSFDGSYTIVPTKRGLAYLGYQQFVASTEQSVTYVSDNIYTIWNDFGKDPVKLYKDSYYIYCYKNNSTQCLLLDTRSNSWYSWLLPVPITLIENLNDETKLILENSLCNFDYSDVKYYDYVHNKRNIDWQIRSQKLHLNAFNYYKHISSITLTSVLDTDKPLTFDLQLINYRDKIDKSRTELIEFEVDTVRTFIQRLNYSKVIEFQYYLQNSTEYEIHVPLSLSSITVKYKIGGQVR